jgi:hypothetical protein
MYILEGVKDTIAKTEFYHLLLGHTYTQICVPY